MEMPNFIYNILPPEKREMANNKRNVKAINKFLRKRKRLQNEKDDELDRLKQLCENGSIDESTYDRLKEVMILTHEQKLIDMLRVIIEKRVRNEKSVNSQKSQPIEFEVDNSFELGRS